jgi:hypothetical protein
MRVLLTVSDQTSRYVFQSSGAEGGADEPPWMLYSAVPK